MRPLHIEQIFHPSGRLFEAWEVFVRIHPHASCLQSPAFFREALEWPDTEPILLLAVNVQKLHDPGRWKGKEEGGRRRIEVSGEKVEDGRKWMEGGEKKAEGRWERIEDGGRMLEDRGVQVYGSLVAGSLLGVIVKKPLPRWMRFWPVSTMHASLFSRTIVYGGPLLAPGSRLEQETTLGLLVEELQRKTRGRSRYTQYRNLFDCSEFFPKFRSLGFRFSEGNFSAPDAAALDSLQLKDFIEKDTGKAVQGMKPAAYGSFTK
jgi:hypothetical protein